MCCFQLLIIRIPHLYRPNSFPIPCSYILTVRIRVSNSFSFLVSSLMSSMYIMWLIFSWYLVSLYPPVQFLCWEVRSQSQRVMVIVHVTGIYHSGFSPEVSFFHLISVLHSSFFNDFLDKIYNFVRYLVQFMTVYYPVLRDHIVCLFCCRSTPWLDSFFVLFSSPWECVDHYIVSILFPALFGIPSVPQGTIHGLLMSCKSPP